MEIILLLIRLFLAAIFALAGVGKLLDLKGAEKAVKDFGAPQDLAKFFAVALPAVELLIALLLLPASTAWFGAIGAFLLLAVFIGGMIWQMAQGKAPDCHCFGQIHSEPVSPKSLIRNGVFALLAFLLILQGSRALSLSELSNELALELIIGLIVTALLGAGVFYLKKITEQLAQVTRRVEFIEALSREGGASQSSEDLTEQSQARLLIGAPAPEFVLPDLSGKHVFSLVLFNQGKSTLLFFVSPTCNPCAELLPEIETWQTELKDRVNFVFISSGTAEENVEKFGDNNSKSILLQNEREVQELFKAQWTPTALLVNADGAIASLPAVGGDGIRQLVEKIKKETDARFIADGDGQKIGENFPEFSLGDIAGNTFDSRQMLGRQTLVAYWGLNCGFCTEMIDELREWNETKGADEPQLLLLSHGDAEKNREMNIHAPVVLDDKHEVAQKLGMTGTPSAILVDEEGKIASEIAVGADNIWALLGRSPGSKV